MKPRELPSVEYLRSLFDYNPEAGTLRWKLGVGWRNCGGRLAGTPNKKREGAPIYLVVKIDKVYYMLHRVMWKIHTGSEPPDFIDHEDTDVCNNRWRNLREATNGQNIQNSRIRKDNKSGVKGLFWEEDRKKWRATVTADKRPHRKRFENRDDAVAFLLKVRPELHGEFARSA